MNIFTGLLFITVVNFSFFGTGTAVFKFLDKKDHSVRNTVFLKIIAGWCFSIFLLSLINIFFPINYAVSILIFSSGIIAAVSELRKTKSVLLDPWTRLLVFCCALWAVITSFGPPQHYDSGLYHYNAVRWLNEFPVVPGIANLHKRLGFNNTFFVYASALKFYPYADNCLRLANPVVAVFTAGYLSERLFALKKEDNDSYSVKILLFTAAVLLLYVFFLPVSSLYMSSPAPDLVSIFLQIIMFFSAAEYLLSDKHNQEFHLKFSAFLAVTAVTVKLSNAAFSSVIFLFVFYELIRVFAYKGKNSFDLKKIFMFLALPCAVFLLWAVRGYIMSGYPLYPSAFGGIDFQWTMPLPNVKDLNDLMKGYARESSDNWRLALTGWQWFGGWFRKLTGHWHFFKPVILSLIFLGFYALASLFRRRIKVGREFFLFVPVVFTFFIWFINAPTPRFIFGVFWLLPLCMSIVFLRSIEGVAGRKSEKIIFTAVLIVLVHPCVVDGAKKAVKYDYTDITMAEVPVAECYQQSFGEGMLTYTPENGDQCWDSPLPCTQYIYEGLKLIDRNDISKGFYIDRKKEDT